MAGSLKWMEYLSDAGQSYAVKIDESNGELTGFIDLTASNDDIPQLPKGFIMRTVTAQDPVTGARRTIPVGTPTDFTAIADTASLLLTLLGAGGLASALTAFTVLYTKGERVGRGVAADTGLTDGDIT